MWHEMSTYLPVCRKHASSPDHDEPIEEAAAAEAEEEEGKAAGARSDRGDWPLMGGMLAPLVPVWSYG